MPRSPKHCDVTVLVDDVCSRRGLRGEHGLSLLVEHGESRLLYDVGQSGLFLENARARGMDLATVDAVVLSHGHYDHLGGLEALLAIKSPLDVYCHVDTFRPRIRRVGTHTVGEVGSPVSRERLEELGARFHFIETESVEVAPGVRVSGEVPRDAGPENVIADIFVEEKNEKKEEGLIDGFAVDRLPDDLFLLLSLSSGAVILTGCAHAGLVNIVTEGERLAEGAPLIGLLGGFHLFGRGVDELGELAAFLTERPLRRLTPMHCSGFLARTELHRLLPEITMLASTGDRVRFS